MLPGPGAAAGTTLDADEDVSITPAVGAASGSGCHSELPPPAAMPNAGGAPPSMSVAGAPLAMSRAPSLGTASMPPVGALKGAAAVSAYTGAAGIASAEGRRKCAHGRGELAPWCGPWTRLRVCGTATCARVRLRSSTPSPPEGSLEGTRAAPARAAHKVTHPAASRNRSRRQGEAGAVVLREVRLRGGKQGMVSVLRRALKR